MRKVKEIIIVILVSILVAMTYNLFKITTNVDAVDCNTGYEYLFGEVNKLKKDIEDFKTSSSSPVGVFYSVPLATTISSSTYGTGKFILFNGGYSSYVSNTGNANTGFAISGNATVEKEIVPTSVSYGSYAFAAYIINVTGDFQINGVSAYLKPYIAKLNDNFDIGVGQQITLNTDLTNWDAGQYIV